MAGEGRFRVKQLAFQVDHGMLRVDCGEMLRKDEAGVVKCGQNTAQAFDLPIPTAKGDLERLKRSLRDALTELEKLEK